MDSIKKYDVDYKHLYKKEKRLNSEIKILNNQLKIYEKQLKKKVLCVL